MNSNVFSLDWLPYLVVAIFVMLPEKQQNISYEMYRTLFAATLIIPLITYVAVHIGIKVPYEILESYEQIKIAHGYFYKKFLFAIQMSSVANLSTPDLRFFGIYDEGGRVGTICALMLCAERLQVKKDWKNFIFIVAGVLSFSMAFYLLLFIYYCCRCLEKGETKRILALILVGIVGVVLLNYDFGIPEIQKFQSRFAITKSGLGGNNRESAEYKKVLVDFYNKSDLYHLLFGNGIGAIGAIQDAKEIDGSSYRSLIYDYGFVGFGLSVLWIVLYALFTAKKHKEEANQAYTLAIIYLANMYQRPSLFYISYLIIFIGGLTARKTNKRGILEGL